VPDLAQYISDGGSVIDDALKRGSRVLIEGTQGFALSPIHGAAWPQCTSRDTTAAAFLSEAGVSPIHVDEVVLVLRCHPIRVAGNSGPLPRETTWSEIANAAGAPHDLSEFTSVTHKLRRVAQFDSEVVKAAIRANQPTKVVLNHLDYVDWEARDGLTPNALSFVRSVEAEIGRIVDWVGLGPETTTPLAPVHLARRA